MTRFAELLRAEVERRDGRWTRDHLLALLCRVVDDVDMPESALGPALDAIAARIGVDEDTSNADADRRTRAFLEAHEPPPELIAHVEAVLNGRASMKARRDAALAMVNAAMRPFPRDRVVVTAPRTARAST